MRGKQLRNFLVRTASLLTLRTFGAQINWRVIRRKVLFAPKRFLSNKSPIHYAWESGKGNTFLNGKWHVQNENGHRSPRSQTYAQQLKKSWPTIFLVTNYLVRSSVRVVESWWSGWKNWKPEYRSRWQRTVCSWHGSSKYKPRPIPSSCWPASCYRNRVRMLPRKRREKRLKWETMCSRQSSVTTTLPWRREMWGIIVGQSFQSCSSPAIGIPYICNLVPSRPGRQWSESGS